MKKFVTIIVLINIVVSAIAQTSVNSPAILYPIHEKTILKIDGQKKELNTTLVCNRTMKIEVVQGKLNLLAGSGDELSYNSGETIIIQKKSVPKNSFPLNNVAKFFDNPSVYLPNLSSSERNKYLIFPTQSKVYDKANIRFYYSEEFSSNATFKLYFKDTDSLIWETNDLQNIKELQKISLVLGQTYCWKIYNGSNSLKGTFELLNQDDRNKLKLPQFRIKKDYLTAFFVLLENECLFDAIAILSESIKKYPESKIFESIFNKILVFNN